MNVVDAREGRVLLCSARQAIEYELGVRSEPPDAVVLSASAAQVGGLFVTLDSQGRLRGCIGYVGVSSDLVEMTNHAAVAAARNDPRFEPVTAADLPGLGISISILSLPEPLADPREIQIGRHGVIVEHDGRRGLLLPQVASERRWEPERFLSETCVKAGLPEHGWREDGAIIRRFHTVYLSERDDASG